jgi:lipopolysaccharide export system protein LptA
MLVMLFAVLTFAVSAQNSGKKVKLIHTDELSYDKDFVDAQRLIGNVHLEYQGTHFYCDSAYLFANDDFDAFSRIRIVEPDGYNVSGDFLHFDKKANSATLKNNIILRDKEITLTTDDLVYHLDTEIANYYGGGKIVSAVNKNTLTSGRGIYHSNTETFYFRDHVVLKNPDYTVNCDTMQYNSNKEVTYFFGPTTILGDKTSIYCENGYYNTKTDQSRFGKNAKVVSETTELLGDSIFYDGKNQFGEVFRDVSIRDTTENYIISGEYGRHEEKTERSFVTGRALLTQYFDGDSLLMHADTLFSQPDSAGSDVVKAFHGVKIFKSDLQGKCDSLVYTKADSTMRMYDKPVLWSQQNQITGDSISLLTSGGNLDKLIVRGSAFIISDAEAKGDSIKGNGLRYNQIKGRNLTGLFADNDLRQVFVEGNGQVVYFPTDDKKEKPVAVGHNKGECSNIFITIENNALQKIRMETETNSVFTPLKMANSSVFRLDNFQWYGEQRPANPDEIFLKTE